MNNSMKGRGEGGTFVLCCGRRLRSFFVTQVRLFDLLPERRLVSETNVDPCKTTDERARAGEGGKREREGNLRLSSCAVKGKKKLLFED
jgi:hypothetical protein